MEDEEAAIYREYVGRVLRGEVVGPLINDNAETAPAAISAFFQEARESIYLLSNTLLPSLYERSYVVDAALSFIRRSSVKLYILVEDDKFLTPDWRKHKFLGPVVHAGPGKVELGIVKPWMCESYKYNFLVMDQTAYRFEEDREAQDAVIGAGASGRPVALKLISAFANMQEFTPTEPLDYSLPEIPKTSHTERELAVLAI